MHNDFDKKHTCDKIPGLYFNDAFSLIQKHMDQWRKEPLIRTVFLSQKQVATNVAKWCLGMEVDNTSIKYEFLDRRINPSGFIIFTSKHVSSLNPTLDLFFIKHRLAIVKVACGDSLLHSNNYNVIQSKKYCMQQFLPIFRNTHKV